MKEPFIFLSYVDADQSWAERFSSPLSGSGIAICNFWSSLKPGEDFEARLRESLGTATHTVVLVGPRTRLSRWVDREMEQSTESREGGPGAALIGVILPTETLVAEQAPELLPSSSWRVWPRLPPLSVIQRRAAGVEALEYWLFQQAFQAATEFSAAREWLTAAKSHLQLQSVDSFLLLAGSLPEVISGPTDTSPKL